MNKIKNWILTAIALALGFPLAIGVAGAFYFATSVDSIKMRLMSASMSGKSEKLTVSEFFQLTLSRLLPIPLVIFGFVGEWYWLKGILSLM